MKKLIQGIIDFRRNVLPSYVETFAKLALEQKPDTLMFACSDSRVVPNLFASSNPGDLFVVRNVGNLIPPFDAKREIDGDEAEAAAIEFALTSLPVRDIIVCGHSECGAMHAIQQGRERISQPSLKSWLRHGEASSESGRIENVLDASWPAHDQLSQANVLFQLDHLRSYPLVAERIAKGKLQLHAWWFHIERADVLRFEPKGRRFVVIDEREGERLLKELR